MAQNHATKLSEALSSDEMEIASWDDFQNHLKSYGGVHRYKWCFRGQANSNWTLRPSIERLIANTRRESVRPVEQVLLNRFRRQAHHYLSRTPSETELVEWFALMQHWGTPTRLLDFTLSPYVALFFALREQPCGTGDGNPTHAAVWAIHHVALQNIAKSKLGIQQARSAEFRKAWDEVLVKDSDIWLVAPIQPFLMNERLAAQQGLFLCAATTALPFDIVITQPDDFRLFVDVKKRKISRDFAQKLRIPLNQRANMLRELMRMNISSASLFPGLEGYAKSIRESYEALGGETPAYKAIALETIENFGWPG